MFVELVSILYLLLDSEMPEEKNSTKKSKYSKIYQQLATIKLCRL